MVGVPRSTGCALCVKRRVKCDQAKPACGNCIKYGASCPGYDRGLKFVAGKHQVRPRHRPGPDASFDTSPSESLSGSPPDSTEPLWSSLTASTSIPDAVIGKQWAIYHAKRAEADPGSSSSSRKALTDPDAGEPTAHLSICPSPGESQVQFIATMIDSIGHSPAGSELVIWAPWFTDATPFLGRSTLMDNAMAAFTLHVVGKANEDDRLVAESRRLYGHSLGALQRTLNHPQQWRTSETMCSTMMLCVFELFAGTTSVGSWVAHAKGVAALMKVRGPDAHKSAWDRNMLLSFRSIIIMNSLFAGEDCFLASRKWQKLLLTLTDEISTETSDPAEKEHRRVTDIYFANLARIPAILRHGFVMREARRHDMPIDKAQVVLLVGQTERLHKDLLAWYKRFSRLVKSPVEIPSKDPTSIHATVLSYNGDIWGGSLHMSYWACMLIVQEVLNQCSYHIDYSESNKEFASNIFRSVEEVSSGIMGPYRVGYALRVAYEFADMKTQVWIKTLLAELEKTYAAVSPTGYPPVAVNEYGYS